MMGKLLQGISRVLRSNSGDPGGSTVSPGAQSRQGDLATPDISKPNARAHSSSDSGTDPDIPYTPVGNFEWQVLNAPMHQVYGEFANPNVVNLLRFPPNFALEIGCNTGMLGHLIKQKFPQATVWGVEPNNVTSDIARTRLDYVLNCTLEQVDWRSVGVGRGEIDTVFLFDVLEHIYDPWSALLGLRNLVNNNAQIIVSIPNVRNLFLIQDLIRGHWRYREMGLLDITHIRFFTDQDLFRIFYQTGFRVMGRTFTVCERSQAVHQQLTGKAFPQQLELDGATINVQSEEELLSFCAIQHIFNLMPVQYDQLSAEERRWIDAPHPETFAYAGVRP